MIWIPAAGDTIAWSSWLWSHRTEFEPVLNRLGGVARFTEAALTNPEGAVRRVGNLIVFGKADGGEQVLAFLEQSAPRVESIEHAVAGVQAGQAALSTSLNSLQSLSMVTLGL